MIGDTGTVSLLRNGVGWWWRIALPLWGTLALLLVTVLSSPARAILVVGKQGRNTSPPTGRLAGSGWQYHGEWGLFLGVAVGPHYFLTAKHVGGLVGDPFLFQGKKYVTINKQPFPDCDLTLWTVSEPMPQFAPLYTGRAEVGREIVVFGRGHGNGEPVILDGRLRGWRWGIKDGLWTWGTNQVFAVLEVSHIEGQDAGEKIIFDFSENGGPNEAAVAPGDSGAGVFIYDEGEWKLAGINYGVSGGYSRTGTEQDVFHAALFDGRGLWRDTGSGFAYSSEIDPYPGATISFSTRISTYAPRLQTLLQASPHHQIFTRRRTTLLAGFLFLLALGAYILRVRPRLQRMRERYQRPLPVK